MEGLMGTHWRTYSSTGSSSVDYFLASEDIFHDFIFLHVFQPNELSDHSVLWAGLQNICNYNLNSENTECNYEISPGKFSLETGSREDFVTALEENKSSTMLNQFLLEVNDPSADINTLADNLSNIILNATNKTFHLKQFKRNKKRKRYKQKWFNGNCHFP